MQTVPISKVKDRLNEFVDSVALTHEQVTITKNGSPAAVLTGAGEWESLQEMLFWLSRPGILEEIAQARQELADRRSRAAQVRTVLRLRIRRTTSSPMEMTIAAYTA